LSQRSRIAPIRRGLAHGYSGIEKIILTLIGYELFAVDIEDMIRVANIMENEICGISLIYPEVEKKYREFVLKALERELPDIPRPELRGCHILDQLLSWAVMNRDLITQKLNQWRATPIDAQRLAISFAVKIARVSQQGVIYSMNLVDMTRRSIIRL